ncbi:hypothetical protein ILYODFUR_004344 [Ilyodon furcidens]|uniref:Uncharacterized protein n=1 Tax=Ilyodon furcidens TaxID=33524 RepID=A0ABV0SIF0_9TELE
MPGLHRRGPTPALETDRDMLSAFWVFYLPEVERLVLEAMEKGVGQEMWRQPQRQSPQTRWSCAPSWVCCSWPACFALKESLRDTESGRAIYHILARTGGHRGRISGALQRTKPLPPAHTQQAGQVQFQAVGCLRCQVQLRVEVKRVHGETTRCPRPQGECSCCST